jgi:phosphatidylglycerol---prolipoprotein diacylglyceryl transferase
MYPYLYIGTLRVSMWWFFLICGYIAAFAGLILTRPKDFSVSYFHIILCVVVFIPASIAGQSFLSAAIHYKHLMGLAYPEIFGNIGAASLGGMISGLLAVWLLSKTVKFSFADMADFGMPFIILTMAFNRIGCLFAGCCYGIPTSLSWGFRFLSDGVMRHPTQAYAMASAFAVFGASRFIYKNLGQVKWLTFSYTVFIYSFLRFINEFLRAEGPYIIGRFKLVHLALIVFMCLVLFKACHILRTSVPKNTIKIMSLSISRVVFWGISSIAIPIAIILISNSIWF